MKPIAKSFSRLVLMALLTASVKVGAIQPLSDNQLDQLTAGNATAADYGQSLPQSLTDSIQRVDTTTVDRQGPHTASTNNSLLVAAESQAAITINHQLQLSDSTQQNSRAITLSNSVGSDLINTSNMSASRDFMQQSLTQNNVTTQAELQLATVGLSYSESGYRYENSVVGHASSHSNSRFAEQIQTDYSHTISNSRTLYDVAIEKYDPRLLLGEIQLSSPNLGPITLIPAHTDSGRISAGDIVNAVDIFDIIPNHVDWAAGWGATTLELPVFSAGIDSSSVTHQNLTLNLTAAPPKLEIGNIYFNTQAHYNDSSDGVVHWIDTQPISFSPPDINVDLEVPNPLYGLDMSINHGFALAGNGELKGDFGGFNGLARINFTNVLSNVFPIDEFIAAIDVGIDVINALDFLNIFPDIPKPGDHNLDLVLTIPIEIDLNSHLPADNGFGSAVTVIDSEQASAFHIKYNGVFCFELFGDGHCGTMTEQVTSTHFTDHSYSGNFSSQDTFSDNVSNSLDQIVRTGGQLSGAKAEKIIISGSQLTSNENSHILLSDQSQKSLSAINVMNASTTIAANSMNIQNFRSTLTSPASFTGFQLNQSNRFIQTR